MPRGRQPPKKNDSPAERPTHAPRRRHPVLLTLVVMGLSAWLGFLVWLAYFR